MNTYQLVINLRAECKSDAEELINDYTGQETDVTILSIKVIGEKNE